MGIGAENPMGFFLRLRGFSLSWAMKPTTPMPGSYGWSSEGKSGAGSSLEGRGIRAVLIVALVPPAVGALVLLPLLVEEADQHQGCHGEDRELDH